MQAVQRSDYTPARARRLTQGCSAFLSCNNHDGAIVVVL